MKNLMYAVAATTILLQACGGSSDSASGTVSDSTGPLPGDPVIIDSVTGEPIPPIPRILLAAGTSQSPFSDETYDTKRFSLKVKAGTDYSIDISNDLESTTDVVAKIRTEYCPANVVGPTEQTIARQSTRTFEYNASRNCDLIIDVNRLQNNGNHRLTINVHLSVGDGLIQDQSSHEPNNSPNSAFGIEGGAEYTSTMGPYDDLDYFSLPVTAGQTINIVVPTHASDNPLRLEVLDALRAALIQPMTSSANNSINTNINASYSGLMYFKFDQTTEGISRTYSFTVTPEG